MTPHLHPRSRLTTSLFGTTFLVSFIVVGIPHIVPCPAPRVKFADAEMEGLEKGQRRRVRAVTDQEAGDMVGNGQLTSQRIHSEEEEAALRKRAHECPVPKPQGIIGQVLGFKRVEREEAAPPTKVELRKQKHER